MTNTIINGFIRINKIKAKRLYEGSRLYICFITKLVFYHYIEKVKK